MKLELEKKEFYYVQEEQDSMNESVNLGTEGFWAGQTGRCSTMHSIESRKTICTYFSAQIIVKFNIVVINFNVKNEKYILFHYGAIIS